MGRNTFIRDIILNEERFVIRCKMEIQQQQDGYQYLLLSYDKYF